MLPHAVFFCYLLLTPFTYKTVKILILSLHLLLVCSIGFGQEKHETLAQRAAASWLQLVDQEKYGESWQEASSLFKAGHHREEVATGLAPGA
jgi:hypothetical protein